jgi:2-polyprenyl-6-methoxyphenol hydroxylase-like FAD-dependent oxidoreductase
MERCNARTMEIYRRMGIAERIRAAGLPADCPMDVFIVTSLIDPPLLHLPYPSVAQAKAAIAARNDGTLPLEPSQLISQYTLEPLLRSVAEAIPHATVRYGCELVAFSQDAACVRARIKRTGASAATAEGASCARSSASRSAATPTCCSFARRCIAVTICTNAFRSARGATITSPTRNPRS